jgi:hypothetical protein
MTGNKPETPPSGVKYQKSSYSGSDPDKTNCVEVALAPDAAWVRDSKDPEGGAFRLPGSGWRGLLAAVNRHNDQQ